MLELTSITQKAQGPYHGICVLDGADVGVMSSNEMKETGEPWENHPTWTCPNPHLKPDDNSNKQVRYPLSDPGPPRL